jgi:hypothetical protein
VPLGAFVVGGGLERQFAVAHIGNRSLSVKQAPTFLHSVLVMPVKH